MFVHTLDIMSSTFRAAVPDQTVKAEHGVRGHVLSLVSAAHKCHHAVTYKLSLVVLRQHVPYCFPHSVGLILVISHVVGFYF